LVPKLFYGLVLKCRIAPFSVAPNFDILEIIYRIYFFMLFYEKIDHRPSFQKILIAFFEISGSSSAPLIFFFLAHGFFPVQGLILICLCQENCLFQILDNPDAIYTVKELLFQVLWRIVSYYLFQGSIGWLFLRLSVISFTILFDGLKLRCSF
jgi:hypothetical protein